jgi:hypothetical protein
MMSFNERLLWFKEQRKKNPKYKWINFIKNKNNKD